MSAAELLEAAEVIWWMAALCGLVGGAGAVAVYWLVELVFLYLERAADKQARIREARWRARWQGFLTEAKEQGLQGREAVLWAANAMRTHRQALRLLA